MAEEFHGLRPIPSKKSFFLYKMVLEDDTGILLPLKDDMASWEKNAPDQGPSLFHDKIKEKRRRHYVGQQMALYGRKKLKMALKNFEEELSSSREKKEGSSESTPEISFFQGVGLQLKTKLFEGGLDLHLQNPWANLKLVGRLNGKADVHFGHHIAPLKLGAKVEYSITEGLWMAKLERPLSEHVKAQTTSVQHPWTGEFIHQMFLTLDRSL